MQILNLQYSPYQNGKISGEYFKKNVKIDIENIKIKIDKNIEIKEKIEEQFNNLKLTFPKYYDEVIGKADGLGIEHIIYFAMLCPEIMNLNLEHCTTIISHNEDDKYMEGNFCLSKVKIDDDNWFITNDMYNMPFGNGVSWNSYGILKTINYCHDDDTNINYIPRYFSQRHISEAKSINDLIKRCKEMKVASGYNVNAIDTKNNIAVSIEVHNGSNSIFRFDMAKKMLHRFNKDIEEINKILEYRSVENKFFNSILQTKEDPYETIFNISYDVENSSKVFLKILLLTPRQIYFIFCLPISAIDFIFAISFYITEIYTISPKRLKKICVIFYLFKNRLIRNTYNNFTFGRYNMCFLVLNIYVNNITDKYLYVFRIYHYIDELIIFV